MTYLFIYGLMKRGESCHNLLPIEELTYIGEGILSKIRPLIIASKYNYPFLLDTTSRGLHVKGEIYIINNDSVLSKLDKLEHHPELNERKLCSVLSALGNQKIFECWTYLLTDFKGEYIGYPCLEEYYNGRLNKYANVLNYNENILDEVKHI